MHCQEQSIFFTLFFGELRAADSLRKVCRSDAKISLGVANSLKGPGLLKPTEFPLLQNRFVPWHSIVGLLHWGPSLHPVQVHPCSLRPDKFRAIDTPKESMVTWKDDHLFLELRISWSIPNRTRGSISTSLRCTYFVSMDSGSARATSNTSNSIHPLMIR